MINASAGQPTREIRRRAIDHGRKNLWTYFRTYQDQSIRGLDLKEAIKAANGEIVGIEMEKAPHPVVNFSDEAPHI